MKNIIWNEKELKNIKKIILTKLSLKLNEDGELVDSPNNKCFNYLNTRNSLFPDVTEELKDLFYITDKDEIIKVLNMTSDIKADPNNRLHFGFITTLSKINPENHEEIFTIFREIIALYEIAINNVSKKIWYDINNTELSQKKLREISNSTEITTEELLVKKEIEKVFIFANGVTESELFIPLLNKLDSNIKSKMIGILNLLINNDLKTKNKKAKDDTYGCKTKIYKKY